MSVPLDRVILNRVSITNCVPPRLYNIKQLEIDFLVTGRYRHPGIRWWTVQHFLDYFPEVTHLTIRYVIPPNLSPEGGGHVALLTRGEIQDVYGFRYTIGVLDHNPFLRLRNLRTLLLDVLCPHGPWGRDSPECWLLYGDLDVFRRNNPNIIVQIRVRWDCPCFESAWSRAATCRICIHWSLSQDLGYAGLKLGTHKCLVLTLSLPFHGNGMCIYSNVYTRRVDLSTPWIKANVIFFVSLIVAYPFGLLAILVHSLNTFVDRMFWY